MIFALRIERFAFRWNEMVKSDHNCTVISLISFNKFPVILREFGVECAEIWCLCAIDRAKFAVDSLLIPENGYSGIGFWVIKYRPTRVKMLEIQHFCWIFIF